MAPKASAKKGKEKVADDGDEGARPNGAQLLASHWGGPDELYLIDPEARCVLLEAHACKFMKHVHCVVAWRMRISRHRRDRA